MRFPAGSENCAKISRCVSERRRSFLLVTSLMLQTLFVSLLQFSRQKSGELMFKLSFMRKLALMGARVTRHRAGSGENETLSVTADLDETTSGRPVSVTRRIKRLRRSKSSRKNSS